MSSNQRSCRLKTFSARAESETLPALSSYLLSLISIKQSNLCVSADVHTTSVLLRLAEEVGDSICVLKTHADIIDDFSDRTIKGLQEIARRKYFLIFEDRKFADIGNTVQSQYTRGPLRIATWAHLTNAHLFPGPALIPSLRAAATSALVSLNQSVSTEISTGTPRSSIDESVRVTEPDTSEGIDPLTTTTTITPTSHPLPPSNPSLSAQPSASSSSPFQKAPLTPNQIDMSHRRNSTTVTATTTISQTFEPSPPNPAALSRSLSSSSNPSLDRASALAELGPPPHARGLLLLAQMSSQDNMLTTQYTDACVAAARANRDFVTGFVAQEDLNRETGDEFLVFTPGVGMPPAVEGGEGEGKSRGDGMGQRWRGPREVVRDEGADVVIVGRGVLGARDRGVEAERYRKEAWRGYKERVGRGDGK